MRLLTQEFFRDMHAGMTSAPPSVLSPPDVCGPRMIPEQGTPKSGLPQESLSSLICVAHRQEFDSDIKFVEQVRSEAQQRQYLRRN